MTQIWGWPVEGDLIWKLQITEEYKMFRSVTRTQKINFDYRINAIKFNDVWKNGATVYMKKDPPFRDTVITITSRNSRGFSFNVEIYYDPRTFSRVYTQRPSPFG
ncbi:hypothetical protein KR018_004643 [Drosophila ironensis]|nr:hypothetical protein KR018_004643 [Drosophila ironensis]